MTRLAAGPQLTSSVRSWWTLVAAAPALRDALRKLLAWHDLDDGERAELERHAAAATGGNVGYLEAITDDARDALALATPR